MVVSSAFWGANFAALVYLNSPAWRGNQLAKLLRCELSGALSPRVIEAHPVPLVPDFPNCYCKELKMMVVSDQPR